MVAALGVLSGLGLYWVATFATILTWFALRVLKSAERFGTPRPTERLHPTHGAPPGEDEETPEEQQAGSARASAPRSGSAGR
jgi:uncharacterized membrane protein YhiD involved in acid resistance